MIDPSGGRDALAKLLADQDKVVQELAQKVAEATARLVNAGVPASQAVSQAMAEAGVAGTLQSTMGPAVVQSLCVGAGIWPQITASGMDLASLATTAMHSTWDGSGLTLSQRLYGTEQAFKTDLIETIQAHVQAKQNAWTTARQIYDGYGFGEQIHQDKLPELPQDLTKLLDQARSVVSPEDFAKLKADAAKLKEYAEGLRTAPLRSAYTQFAEAVQKGTTKGLNRLVRTAAEEKARYHASRILRTETARAWGQGFFEQARTTARCIGVRWSLSSAHRIFDVCDFCAGANLYGMGPGIYPKDRCPSFPAHPFCFCGLTMVFKGQVPDPTPQVGPGGKAWIQSLPEGKRSKLLTRRGEQAFRGGKSWEGSLRNWDGIDQHVLSNGAASVLREVKNTGVLDWQPPLSLTESLAAPARKFVVPTSVGDAESMIRALGMKADLTGMSLDHAQGASRALFKMVVEEEMPVPTGVVMDFTRGGGAIKIAGDDSTIMLGADAAKPGEWARLREAGNAIQRRKWDAWAMLSDEEKAAQLRAGEFAPSQRGNVSENIYDTVIHEYGHFIHSLSWDREASALQTDILGFQDLTGRTPKAVSAFRKFASPTTSKAVEIRAALSQYATTNFVETFAEAFNAMYSKGETLPKDLERVVRTAVEFGKQAGKGASARP